MNSEFAEKFIYAIYDMINVVIDNNQWLDYVDYDELHQKYYPQVNDWVKSYIYQINYKNARQILRDAGEYDFEPSVDEKFINLAKEYGYDFVGEFVEDVDRYTEKIFGNLHEQYYFDQFKEAIRSRFGKREIKEILDNERLEREILYGNTSISNDFVTHLTNKGIIFSDKTWNNVNGIPLGIDWSMNKYFLFTRCPEDNTKTIIGKKYQDIMEAVVFADTISKNDLEDVCGKSILPQVVCDGIDDLLGGSFKKEYEIYYKTIRKVGERVIVIMYSHYPSIHTIETTFDFDNKAYDITISLDAGRELKRDNIRGYNLKETLERMLGEEL